MQTNQVSNVMDLSYLWNERNQKGVKVHLAYVTDQQADYQVMLFRL